MIFNLTSNADCLSLTITTTAKKNVQKIPIKIFVKNVNHKWKQQGLCYIRNKLVQKGNVEAEKLQNFPKKKKMDIKYHFEREREREMLTFLCYINSITLSMSFL